MTTIFSFPTNPFAVSPSFLLHSLVNAITQYPKHLLPLSARYKSYIDKQLYYILFLLRSLHVLLNSLTLLSSSRLHFTLLFSLYNEPQLVLSPCREQKMHLFILQQQRSVSLSLSRHSFPLGLHWSFSTLSSTKNGTMLSNEPFSYPILQSLMFNSFRFVSFVAKQNTDNI